MDLNQPTQTNEVPMVVAPQEGLPPQENLYSTSSPKNKSVVLALVLLILGLLSLLVYLFYQNTQLRQQVELNELENPVVVTCEYNGQTYEAGEGFTASDGCNSCSCDGTGEVACTLMACEKESEQEETITIEDWEAYSNTEYAFKHPPGLKSDTGAAGNGVESIRVTHIGPEQIASGRTQTSLLDGYQFIVIKYPTTQTTTPQDKAVSELNNEKSQTLEVCGKESTNTPLVETTIAGIIAQQFTIDGCFGVSVQSYLEHNGDLYKIVQFYTGEESRVMNYLDTTNQILSTFEFTD